MTRYSSPSSLTSVPAYLAKSTLSPDLTSISTRLPLSRTRPGPIETTEPDTTEAQAAVDVFGQKLVVAKASTESEIDSAFATFVQQRVAALFLDAEPFLMDQRAKIVAFAAQHALPAVSQLREFAAAGGLVSYGTSITAANRQLGVYTGRVLKGTKPSDLPVIQSTTFELIINLKTAKMLGLTIPQSLLRRADEVIQ